MRIRPIMDAGPGINFFSIHKERLLLRTLGLISIPETVRDEITRRSRHDKHFSAAEAGADVIVLIDDGDGYRLATREAQRLNRLREQGRHVGNIGLIGTLTVLERAAGGPDLRDRAAMRTLYKRLRGLDDGIPPLSTTNLMDLPCWRNNTQQR